MRYFLSLVSLKGQEELNSSMWPEHEALELQMSLPTYILRSSSRRPEQRDSDQSPPKAEASGLEHCYGSVLLFCGLDIRG